MASIDNLDPLECLVPQSQITSVFGEALSRATEEKYHTVASTIMGVRNGQGIDIRPLYETNGVKPPDSWILNIDTAFCNEICTKNEMACAPDMEGKDVGQGQVKITPKFKYASLCTVDPAKTGAFTLDMEKLRTYCNTDNSGTSRLSRMLADLFEKYDEYINGYLTNQLYANRLNFFNPAIPGTPCVQVPLWVTNNATVPPSVAPSHQFTDFYRNELRRAKKNNKTHIFANTEFQRYFDSLGNATNGALFPSAPSNASQRPFSVSYDNDVDGLPTPMALGYEYGSLQIYFWKKFVGQWATRQISISEFITSGETHARFIRYTPLGAPVNIVMEKKREHNCDVVLITSELIFDTLITPTVGCNQIVDYNGIFCFENCTPTSPLICPAPIDPLAERTAAWAATTELE